MHVNAVCVLTNFTEKPVQIVRTHLERPSGLRNLLRWRKLKNLKDGLVVLYAHPNRGQRLIAVFPTPLNTAVATAIFTVLPPIYNQHGDFIATVVFTDQYGNEYRTRNLTFEGR